MNDFSRNRSLRDSNEWIQFNFCSVLVLFRRLQWYSLGRGKHADGSFCWNGWFRPTGAPKWSSQTNGAWITLRQLIFETKKWQDPPNLIIRQKNWKKIASGYLGERCDTYACLFQLKDKEDQVNERDDYIRLIGIKEEGLKKRIVSCDIWELTVNKSEWFNILQFPSAVRSGFKRETYSKVKSEIVWNDMKRWSPDWVGMVSLWFPCGFLVLMVS